MIYHLHYLNTLSELPFVYQKPNRPMVIFNLKEKLELHEKIY